MSLSQPELDEEYKVTKQTRLVILCDDRTPTLEQEHMAHIEAIEHTKALRRSSSGLQQLIDLGDSL